MTERSRDPRNTAAPKNVMVLIAGVAGAAAALWLASTTYLDTSMAGYPDGHLTDYDTAVATPLHIVTWLAAGFAVLFGYLAFSPIRTRAHTVGLLLALVVFGLITTVAVLGIPWFFGTRLGLDTGIGG